ncbi:MAG: hypothetical protein IPK00_27095 [Deltaproteobacteria bacterium]|nr:hypothetical protein [Deltaproteobacteria bacterium]
MAIRPEREKMVRLEGQTDLIEGVRVASRVRQLGRKDFIAEILAFPDGRFDDQIDSLSQFLVWGRRADDPRRLSGGRVDCCEAISIRCRTAERTGDPRVERHRCDRKLRT